MPRKPPIGFSISMSARNDGTIEAMYVRFSAAKVSATVEVEEDVLFADYDRNGRMIGVEVLAPISIATLLKNVEPPRRKSLRAALSNAPQELVRA